MTEVELKPYSTYREGDFTAEVSEMGIKEFGEEAVRKAYLNFTDDGAPITFALEKKDGSSFIETDGQIKAFYDLGNFAAAVKKFGFKTIIDVDLDNPTFRTEPTLEGKVTTWKAKKTKSTSAEGETREFTNFTLVNIEGIAQTQIQQPKKDATKKSESKPSAITKDNLSELSEVWKEVLVEILDKPLNEAGILKAVNAKLPDDDKRKSMHKVRRQVLQELVKAKFLNISDDGKYNVEA
jgi:hypothetical protein